MHVVRLCAWRVPKSFLCATALFLVHALSGIGLCATNEVAVTNVVGRGIECLPFGGVKYDSVAGPSASLCVFFPVRSPFERPHVLPGGREVFMCSHTLVVPEIEVGRDGGKLQVGFGELYFAGWAVKLSVLRTWGDPSGAEACQTYVGGEFHLNLLMLDGGVGVYRHVRGWDNDHDTLVTWSVGLGF